MVKWELFELEHSLAGDFLAELEYPWQALAKISDWLERLAELLGPAYRENSPGVWIHQSARVAPTACIEGKCIIGPGTQVRHGAFIRGDVLIGGDCVVGNSVELKNAILFDGAQVCHFNYVGDSILGYRAHMGAGSITSNVRADYQDVNVQTNAGKISTGRMKCGAMVGDLSEIGCNSVLNPGTIVGRSAVVYPTSCVRGTVPADTIWKNDGTMVLKR